MMKLCDDVTIELSNVYTFMLFNMFYELLRTSELSIA